MTQNYRALRGTHDLLPDEIGGWLFLEKTAREIFSRYGFREIRTPILESTSLFTRSVGASSDIVRKEMYTFASGDDSVTLRPENTASVVRAFIQHSLHRNCASGYPERYFYIGPMFRRERPQKGRQRQFHQIGVELLGAEEPLADSETLAMVDQFLTALGVDDRQLVISSVGDDACRPQFREALKRWLEPRLEQLCEDCNRRYEENPLRVFDCKVEQDRTLLEQAPKMLDLLCAPCAEHLSAVRAGLDAAGVNYVLDDRMVRGLDYYRRTVFEVTSKRLGAQDALLGGGRYDGLVRELGGADLPGFGFAMGMERTISLIDPERGSQPRFDVAVIGLGAAGFAGAQPLTARLRAAGLRVLSPLVERPMGAQLKRANRAGARYALFVGQDEMAAGRYGLKNLATGEQNDVVDTEIEQQVRPSQ